MKTRWATGSGVRLVFASVETLHAIAREVKILMRLPDGRNVATRQAFTGAHHRH